MSKDRWGASRRRVASQLNEYNDFESENPQNEIIFTTTSLKSVVFYQDVYPTARVCVQELRCGIHEGYCTLLKCSASLQTILCSVRD